MNTASRTSRGKPLALLIFLFCCCSYRLFAQSDTAKATPAKTDTSAPKKPRPMSWKDIPSWKYINPQKVELSPDGKWLAYPMLTTEGEGELILKSTKDTVTRKFAIGGNNQPNFGFSEDGQWIAIKQSSSFKDIRGAARTLQRLADMEVGAWLDDFGTGYSSLNHLRSLPLKGVKIDRSFVERIDVDARDFGFLKALIDLVSYLGMQSIVEGIETPSQYELVSLTACDLYQGYFFSRGLSAVDAERWIREAPAGMSGQSHAALEMPPALKLSSGSGA